ncbi:MAG: DUF262 domain-containing protein [Pelagibacterales bacterium]|nr:DUF262 domain-containing protein [Pelagibacterales bacterium]
MSKNFNTSNESFRKIIGNGITYVVPKFQRDYSWDSEQWEDLWQDIVEQLEEKNSEDQSHYMGYLVLQSVNDKEFKIIDGQQRITTLMILILAALENINRLIEMGSDVDKNNNKMRLETLKSTYIGFTDPVSLITKPKLRLNKNNQSYFRSLCTLGSHIQQTKIKGSERLLLKAKKFFEKKIENSYFSNDGEGIARFIDKMSDILFFTSITVSSDLNAYKVFETLNARGVKLSTPDLIKNHLFSMNEFEEGDSCSLGNMTLLDKKTNKDLSTKSFEEKKLFFGNYYKITSQLCEFEEWNHYSIIKRQKWLAEQAAKCWKIEFSS